MSDPGADSHVALDTMRPAYEGPPASLWFLGIVRIGVLFLATAGTFTLGEKGWLQWEYLLAFYVFGLASSLWYLFTLRRARGVSTLLTGAQVLVDFGVVAATVSFTGGPQSSLTFLFVVVILEAGLLMGVLQSFLIATLAAVVMFSQVVSPSTTVIKPDPFALWYNYVIALLAFYLTASISGYWNQRVRRMQQFQHEILDNLNSGFLIADRNGVIISSNRAANAVLELEPDWASGRPAAEVLRVQSGAECPINTALRLERDFTSYEFLVLTSRGNQKLLGLTTSRIYDSRRHVTGIIASFSDLTEMANMRQELQRHDRLAVIGELAAGLAHEIRNPVAAIRGAVDELQNNLSERTMAERLTRIALRESDHLNQIVTGFLDFARKPSMHRETFDVRGLVREVADWMERRYNTDRLTVRVVAPDVVCAISGDRSQIRQVFLNIAKNGIEAMGEQGELSMVVTRRATTIDVVFDDKGPGIE
ncbi:MAG: histidine kinase dimerization/phospho-acceptor domain-containing protein, partial [FCB group bacterium]|nr:histidine kinase dimerization/phospho-acceptor domain-containing protein [FCB group bacterium]